MRPLSCSPPPSPPNCRPTPCRAVAAFTSSATASSAQSLSSSKFNESDVIVIGSGIGGLSCAGLLARYGLDVTVLESHTVPGGAAHTWQRRGPSGVYHFESGPSLYSGMAARGPAANPLALVLQAIDEPLELLTYDAWNVITPELPTGYPSGVGIEGFDAMLTAVCGPDAVHQWRRLQEEVEPLSRAAAGIPPLALRLDPGVAITALFRFFPSLVGNLPSLTRLTGPFSDVIDGLEDKLQREENTALEPFIRNYLNLLCFLLSGLPSDGTITAETAFMMKEWFDPGAKLEFPKGGSQAMVEALVRGVTKRGGRVRTGCHVEEILTENSRAVGVKLRNGESIRARKAVVSNASTPDTLHLLYNNDSSTRVVEDQKQSPGLRSWRESVHNTPINPSFMHLHLGFDGTGLDTTLDMHHIVVNSWDRGVDAEQNVVLISVPSVLDPTLAPPGKHTLHAYVPATEPWGLWQGLDRASEGYEALKEERARVLWDAVERAVCPDIRSRAEIVAIGTPLTHSRYLRRYKGSYGAAWRAGEATFPFGTTPIDGLYCCGDFVFPGIGLPAVAASGAIVANSLVPLHQHLELLSSLGL